MSPAAGSITVTVRGNGFAGTVNGVTVAAFNAGTNTPVGSPCITAGSGQCAIGVPNGTYDVRVTAAPPPFSPIASVWLGTAFGIPLAGGNPAGVFAYQPDSTGGQLPDPITVNDNTPSTRLVVQRNNPPQPTACGIDIALIIDRSGSTLPDDQTYKNAASDFVTALQGTPSRVGVWQFAAGASQVIALTDVSTVAGANAVKTAITNMATPSGGTNWDQGISQVAASGADAAILITDGNPTTQSGQWDPDTGSTGDVNVYDVEGGIASANLVKNAGIHFISVAVGISNTVNLLNLSPAVFPIANAGALQQLLTSIATALCGGTITVKKEVPNGQGGWQFADGWTFTATSNGPAPTPGSGATGDSGNNSILFDFNNVGSVTAGITETVLDNSWQLVQQGGENAVCLRNQVAVPAGQIDSSVANKISLTLGPTDVVICTFRNQPSQGKLEVKKDLNPAADPGLFNLQIDAGTLAANVGDGGTTGEQPVNTGSHTVGETQGTGTDLSDYTKSIECKAGNGSGAIVASNSGQASLDVNVGSGDDIVCVITNTRKTGKIEVKKDLNPSADSGKFNLQVDGVTKAPNVGDGGTTGEVSVNTGDHTVGETAGTGTSLSNYSTTIECKAENGNGAVVADTSGAGPLQVPVGKDDDIICVITNDLKKLEISKTVTSAPSFAGGTWTIAYDVDVDQHRCRHDDL